MSARPWLTLLLITCTPSALAGPPSQPRNDSGVDLCYDAQSAQAGCALPGFPRQDARFGRDAAARDGVLAKIGGGMSGFDYTKIANDGSELAVDAALGDGPGDWACTRDNVTGLVWEVKTDDGALRDKDWTYTWYSTDANDNGGDVGAPGGDTCSGSLGSQCNTEALAVAVNATGLCGFDNWRMPTSDELFGLIHFGIVAGAGEGTPATIDGDYFPNTITDAIFYWTADPYASNFSFLFAWLVAFNDGASNFANKDIPAAARLVRDSGAPKTKSVKAVTCTDPNLHVRPNTDGAFTINADGTATDARTGLSWDRCLRGQDADNACAGPGAPYTWQQALQEVETLNAENYLGHADWRVPNVKELRSLVERSCVSPAVDIGVFPNTPNDPATWTSTTYPFLPTHAWVIAFDSGGYAGSFSKTFNHRVRLVRGGFGADIYDTVIDHDFIFVDGFDPPPT